MSQNIRLIVLHKKAYEPDLTYLNPPVFRIQVQKVSSFFPSVPAGLRRILPMGPFSESLWETRGKLAVLKKSMARNLHTRNSCSTKNTHLFSTCMPPRRQRKKCILVLVGFPHTVYDCCTLSLSLFSSILDFTTAAANFTATSSLHSSTAWIFNGYW